MDFKSIADLLHFAISKEQASRQFYMDLALRAKDTGAQKIFEAIAKQEEQHEEALRLEVLKQGYTLGPEGIRVPSSTARPRPERAEPNPDVAG